MKAMKRDYLTSSTTMHHVCEDHFDVKKQHADAQIWMAQDGASRSLELNNFVKITFTEE